MSDAKPLRVIDPVPFIGGAPDPKPEDVLYVTYPDTFDGWLAAWVVRKAVRQYQLHANLQLVHRTKTLGVTGRKWIELGPSFTTLSAQASRLTIGVYHLDGVPAPTPFKDWKRKLPFGIESMGDADLVAVYNSELASVASMTYEFFYGHRVGFEPTPRLLQLNEDAVSGRGNIQFSRQIVECAKSYPFDFQMLDRLVEATEDKKRRENMIIAGQAICRYIDKNSLS